MTTKEICSLQDEGISELVEEENKGKITDLKKFLNDLDDAQDYENLLKKIDKNVLNGKIILI
jgi:transcriptional regulator of heat shock response